MAIQPTPEQLAEWLIEHFETPGAFHAFALAHVYPGFRAKRTTRARTSPINARFVSADGHELTDAQVELAAKEGTPLRERSTAQLVIFENVAVPGTRRTYGRWVPCDTMAQVPTTPVLT